MKTAPLLPSNARGLGHLGGMFRRLGQHRLLLVHGCRAVFKSHWSPGQEGHEFLGSRGRPGPRRLWDTVVMRLK